VMARRRLECSTKPSDRRATMQERFFCGESAVPSRVFA
jgi:hypothetical protein